jgi:hypothetical protein
VEVGLLIKVFKNNLNLTILYKSFE